LIAFFFCAISIFAQVPRYNQGFINHMMRFRLENDHLNYLNKLYETVEEDTVQYEQLRYDLYYQHQPTQLLYPGKLNSTILSDTCLSLLFFDEFMRYPGEQRSLWLNTMDWGNYHSNLASVMEVYGLANGEGQVYDFPEELEPTYWEVQKFNRRKPFVAAMLSTAVPGLGKVYAGRPHTFWGSFIMNAIFGLHAYDVYRGLGPKHWYTYFAGGSFGVFYFSNIVGSYIDLKRVRKEKKQLLINEALDYYIHCNLY
jgi:TM2 domain-containing membrane protein YozV